MAHPIHITEIRVRYGDTDAAGVVYNANYLRYFEIGRSELMREWVCSYKEIEALGFILPVTECFSRFKAPAFYDDLLSIETSIDKLTKLTCRFHYSIRRLDSQLERPKLVAKGHTVHASVNNDGKLAALPDEILSKLNGLLKTG